LDDGANDTGGDIDDNESVEKGSPENILMKGPVGKESRLQTQAALSSNNGG
jgi:hypothetical protein